MHNIRFIRRRFPNQNWIIPTLVALSASGLLVGLGILLLGG